MDADLHNTDSPMYKLITSKIFRHREWATNPDGDQASDDSCEERVYEESEI